MDKNTHKNYSKLLEAIRNVKVEESIIKKYDFNLSSFEQDKSGKIKIKNKKES